VRFMSIASIRPCVSRHNAQDKYIGQMILQNPNSIDIITHSRWGCNWRNMCVKWWMHFSCEIQPLQSIDDWKASNWTLK